MYMSSAKFEEHCFSLSRDILYSVFYYFRACLHGGGGPQVGEVTRLGGVTRLSI